MGLDDGTVTPLSTGKQFLDLFGKVRNNGCTKGEYPLEPFKFYLKRLYFASNTKK